MATAHLEPLSSIIRIGAEGSKHGDSYDWCATVRHLSTTEVEVCGALTAPSVTQWRAILDVLGSIGVERAMFRRKMPDGTFREKWVKVK